MTPEEPAEEITVEHFADAYSDFGTTLVFKRARVPHCEPLEQDLFYRTTIGFEVHKIIGRDKGKPLYKGKDDELVLVRTDTLSIADPVTVQKETSDVSEAEPEFSGSVRWDGCTNLHFPDCVHLCGPVEWDWFNEALKMALVRCKEIMLNLDTWEGD